MLIFLRQYFYLDVFLLRSLAKCAIVHNLYCNHAKRVYSIYQLYKGETYGNFLLDYVRDHVGAFIDRWRTC